jgi:hypothetical protein
MPAQAMHYATVSIMLSNTIGIMGMIIFGYAWWTNKKIEEI